MRKETLLINLFILLRSIIIRCPPEAFGTVKTLETKSESQKSTSEITPEEICLFISLRRAKYFTLEGEEVTGGI